MEAETYILSFSDEQMLLARCVAAGILILLAIFGTRFIRFLLRAVYKRIKGHMAEWLQILCHGFAEPVLLICRGALIFLAFMCVTTSTGLQLFIARLLAAAFVCLLGWGFWRSSGLCSLLLKSAQNKLDLESNKTITSFFEKIYRAIVLVFTVIFVLDLYGVPVTGLLTGAGIAGLAVSLAAQSTLSNLMAGVMLVLEHPFGLGDYIQLGTIEGTVEEISFRSTRLRTMDNVLISVENSKVSAEYIQNVTNRTSRMMCITVGVTYDTPRETIEMLMKDFAALLKGCPGVESDRVTVNLAGFGASSIDIELRAYVTKLKLNDYNALKNDINLKIMDVMDKHGCSFAFPSTSVYIENAEK